MRWGATSWPPERRQRAAAAAGRHAAAAAAPPPPPLRPLAALRQRQRLAGLRCGWRSGLGAVRAASPRAATLHLSSPPPGAQSRGRRPKPRAAPAAGSVAACAPWLLRWLMGRLGCAIPPLTERSRGLDETRGCTALACGSGSSRREWQHMDEGSRQAASKVVAAAEKGHARCRPAAAAAAAAFGGSRQAANYPPPPATSTHPPLACTG